MRPASAVRSAPAADCALERWREAGLKDRDRRAREAGREGRGTRCSRWGKACSTHNPDLRAKLDSGAFRCTRFFEQLLRVVYRLMFLAVAEDRDLLHGRGRCGGRPRELYASAYGFSHMRERSARRTAHDRHHDHWEGAKIVFAALQRGEQRLWPAGARRPVRAGGRPIWRARGLPTAHSCAPSSV